MAQANGTWRDRIRRAFQARDEGELENAINELPENAELHLHVGGNGNGAVPGDQIPSGMPMPVDNALKAHDAELEELWQALNGKGRSRDAFIARSARRKRMGIFDEEEKKDDDDKTGDKRAGGRDEDKDDEDKEKKNGDAFRDPPEAGGDGNRRIIPGFEMEAPPGTADANKKARDSAFMSDSYQQTCAYAEVLVPGIALPTFDSASPPKKTFDALCGFRSKVIDLAWTNPETRTLIEDLTGGHFTGDVKTLDCSQIRDLFIAAGATKARENAAMNRRTGAPPVADGASHPVGTMTLQTIQDAQNDFWKDRRQH